MVSDTSRVLVRPPRPGDGDGLARSWIDAGEYYTSVDPECFQIPESAGLANWLEEWALKVTSEDACMLVAEVDGQAVGLVWAVVEQPIPNAARQFVRDVGLIRLMIHALVVQRAYWRRGIGTRLMQYAEAWGRSQGAEIALLDTYVGSDVSVPFYERRMGYHRRALRFVKTLS